MSHLGSVHWFRQRLSSLILIPLTLWLIWAGISLAGADYSGAIAFFETPLQAGMGVVFIAITAYHAQNGIQVICEDYIASPGLEKTLIGLTRLACTLGFLAIAWALYHIAFGAGS